MNSTNLTHNPRARGDHGCRQPAAQSRSNSHPRM